MKKMNYPTKREKFQGRAKGCIRDSKDDRDHKYADHRKVLKESDLPNTGDALVPYIALTRDQMQVGMCTGCGTSNGVESRAKFLIATQKAKIFRYRPSALALYAMTRKLEGTPLTEDSGAQIRDVFKAMSQFGLVPEDSNPKWSWPFSASDNRWQQDLPEACYEDALKHRIIKYMRLDNDPVQIKSALAQGMSVVIGIDVYESMESQKVANTGFIPMPGLFDSVQGGHCMWLFGYNNAKKGYFDGQNSWGQALNNPESQPWGASFKGQSGFFHIPEKYICDPRLTSDIWAVDLVV